MSKKDEHRATKHQTSPDPATDGAFKCPNFAKSVTSLIGNNVKVKTKNGSTYEGVLLTMNSDYELIISLSQEIGPDDYFAGRVKNGEIAFNPDDIVSISCVNVNLKEALDLSKRYDGDYPPQRDEIDHWDLSRRNELDYKEKSWCEFLRERNNAENVEYNDLANYSSLALNATSKTHDDIVLNLQPYEYPDRKEYPERSSLAKTEFSEESNVLSTLNPYAKPFTPMESTGKESTEYPSTVLPIYDVNPEGPHYGKFEQLSSAPHNQFMPYASYSDGFNEKYSSYDSVPLSPHDYQQYYPHLQYIQYFRRYH